MVWVFKKSDVQPLNEKGEKLKINPEKLYNPVSNQYDVIIEGALFDTPQSPRVELIDKDRLRQRTRVWVKKGEEEPYHLTKRKGRQKHIQSSAEKNNKQHFVINGLILYPGLLQSN